MERGTISATALGAFVFLLTLTGIVATHAAAEQSSQPGAAVAGQLDAGKYHTCSVLPTAVLRCWGYGGDGALGHGDKATIGDDEAPSAGGPVDVGAGRTVRAVSAGAVHTCAVLDDGATRCWGFGGDGRLGYGNITAIGDDELPSSIAPVDIGAGRTAKAITTGRAHSCVILDTDAVRCWGYGFDGRLGYGTTASIGDGESPASVGPVALGAGRTARAISAGDSHSCAILDDASVRCWGYGANGQLGYSSIGNVGDDETPDQIGPVNLGAGRTAVALSSGDFHTCAILDDATLRCWGFGGNGRLGYANSNTVGDDETPGSLGPVDIGSGRTARAISGGDAHTCVLLDNGSVRCWGSSSNGQLGYGNRQTIGDGETPGSVGPVDLGPGRTAVAISAAGDHTCARLDDGSTRCWGRGLNGELGTCAIAALGDDESPASRAPIDLGVPGVPGTGCTEPVTPPPPPPVTPPPAPAPVPLTPPPPATANPADSLQEALRLQAARMDDLRACRASATSKARDARSRAQRRYRRRPRALESALRSIARRTAQRRARCMETFGRRPGRVTTLSARLALRATVMLRFDATGSDGPKPPAARGYLVKQSTRPIRTTGQFERATALCKGTCRFDDITDPGADLRLRVTGLRRKTTYYYAIAARDNVSGRRGMRSRTISIKTR